jgi:hypothetical protein
MLPGALFAQSADCGLPASLYAAAGVAQHDQVDATIAPEQFEGRGGDYTFGLDFSADRFCLLTTARGGAHSLTAVRNSLGREDLIDGGGSIALLRAISSPRALTFFAGAELRADVSDTRYAYSNPQQTESEFRLGVATLGPAVMTRLVLGHSAATMQLSSPLAALVDHPYTALWSGNSGPAVRAVSLNALRGVNATLAYTFNVTRSIGFRASYSAALLRYDDSRSVRTLTQSLAAGARVAIGRRR